MRPQCRVGDTQRSLLNPAEEEEELLLANARNAISSRLFISHLNSYDYQIILNTTWKLLS